MNLPTLRFRQLQRRNKRRCPANTGNSKLPPLNLDCLSTMKRPFAQHPPSRPVRTHIEAVRVPAGVRHLLGGGGEYAYVEPRCMTCMHEDREIIENMVFAGKPYSFIARQIPPDRLGRTLDPRSISRHARMHMGLTRQRRGHPIVRRKTAAPNLTARSPHPWHEFEQS
jgi:hypothetical protein